MPFKLHTSSIRTIRHNDDNFIIHDDMTMSPRAGFEISQRCPENYRDIIQECIGHGWLRPVAYMKDSELVWETLQQ